MQDTLTPLPPGSVIGVLGGGQLGRMLAVAAAQLGYRCHIFCQSSDEPAAQVAVNSIIASFDDTAALERFADACDVVTLEFENVPLTAIDVVSALVPVRPGRKALEVAQDRLTEKDFVRAQDILTAEYFPVASSADLAAAQATIGAEIILKTRRLGYDGKGQVRIDRASDLASCWDDMKTDAAIAEAVVSFEREISVIVARDTGGSTACFEPVENRHVDGILDRTIAPAPIPGGVAEQARAIAETLASELEIIGLLAVEMFVTASQDILVNEIAPRPHNSGHWTLDACATSQFEQAIRAVAGLPLGDPQRHSDAEMHNLIGASIDRWLELAAVPQACVHLYGKADARPGRKMGHVTYIRPRAD